MAGFHSPPIASPAIMNECLSLLSFKPGARIGNGCRGVFPALPDRGQSATAGKTAKEPAPARGKRLGRRPA